MSLKTPVLFLIFNRPDLTEQVFTQIREAKPELLFIAADGPRANITGESELCEKARNIVLEHIDWNCKTTTLFRDDNLGCKKAVSSAIDWFFSQVEEGIVLEDDTLPSQSFFRFCEETLERYRNDTTITTVCGLNFLNEYAPTTHSYFFSKIIGIWGWATWRRVWEQYDVDMNSWGNKKNRKTVKSVLANRVWYNQFKPIFNTMYKHEFDTWDFQWIYTQLKLDGKSIIPAKNLISNLGFREDASHTKNNDTPLAKLVNNNLEFPLTHPIKLLTDHYYDQYYFSVYVPPPVPFYNKVKSKLKAFVSK